jgi:hypothetical protein
MSAKLRQQFNAGLTGELVEEELPEPRGTASVGQGRIALTANEAAAATSANVGDQGVHLPIALVLQLRRIPVRCHTIAELDVDTKESLDTVLGKLLRVSQLRHVMVDFLLDVQPRPELPCENPR